MCFFRKDTETSAIKLLITETFFSKEKKELENLSRHDFFPDFYHERALSGGCVVVSQLFHLSL